MEKVLIYPHFRAPFDRSGRCDIQGVSGGIVNILGCDSMEYSEEISSY
jgi:hypothetical protein